MHKIGFVLVSFLVVGCSAVSGGKTFRLDGGTTDDLATAGGGDLAMAAKPDLAMAAGTQGCHGLIGCQNACMDQACVDACVKMTTQQGQSLFLTLYECLFGGQGGSPAGACPDSNGGVCDQTAAGFNNTACNNCLSGAQKMTGACYQSLTDCNNDTP